VGRGLAAHRYPIIFLGCYLALRQGGSRVILPSSAYRWVEGCLERIGEDNPEEELLFRDLWEDETQRDVVIDCLKVDCEVRTGRPLRL
jgi:hypothetical protein